MSIEKKSISFIDLKHQQEIIKASIDENISRVMSHGKYILGPEVYELEEKLAEFVGVNYCIGVSSGTDALLLALMALGIKRNDEVITTSFSFIAAAETIALLGAKPVFVDIDSRTFNIDPKKIENAITSDTKAIVAVNLFGQCADYYEINKIANRNGIPVIEDAAQSLGAAYKGQKSCALTTVGCTSFFPSKPLGGYGDGGACFCNDENLAKIIKQLRVHGQSKRYHHSIIGTNSRLDTLQAAILLAKLELFPSEIEARINIGQYYTEAIKNRAPHILPPFVSEHNLSVYAQYSILTKERERYIELLHNSNIPTAIHYPLPLHKQDAFNATEDKLPISESISKNIISIPMHPYLTPNEQDFVIDHLAND